MVASILSWRSRRLAHGCAAQPIGSARRGRSVVLPRLLYGLEVDPGERHDRAAAERETVARLARLINAQERAINPRASVLDLPRLSREQARRSLDYAAGAP
ncbi:MAG: hypothetical protein ACOCYP_05290 [Planctomycetota bacterium]